MNLLLANLHGHLAMLGVALCFHPWLAIHPARPIRSGTRLSIWLASSLLLAGQVLGWLTYPAYRTEVKRELYLSSPTAGMLFEAKEHMAFFALVLALAGGWGCWTCRKAESPSARRSIQLLFGLAAWLGLAVGALGIWVSAQGGFDYGS